MAALRTLLSAVLAAAAFTTACAQNADTGRLASTVTTTSSAMTSPAPATQPTTDDPYINLASALHGRNVAVWWEADLVSRWLEGSAAFHTAVDRLGMLAQSTPTAGFKVADELGYHDGLTSPKAVMQFLRATRHALRKVAPGVPILVDAIVPDLGCLPWRDAAGAACADSARADAPGADMDTVTSYLQAGLVDSLDLSTGLLSDSAYADRGLDLRTAQTEAWQHVVGLGWPTMTVLRARKALADDAGYQGDTAQAAADVGTFVDVPVAAGARSVDIWTWRQAYQGGIYSLLDPALDPNPLWTALQARHDGGVPLFTHLTPSTLPASASPEQAHELDLVASVFDSVFVAAGTG